MIQLIIADDHPLVREGVKKVLDKEIDMEIIAEACDNESLMKQLGEHSPDILVLDMRMPGQSGLDAIKAINSRYSALPILILSIHPARQFAVRALKAGASGYLNKSSISEELIGAIRRIVTRKKRYITDEVAEELAAQLDADQGQPLYESLSDREFEVLCLIARGKNVATIARQLSLSPHTVHTYRSRIKEKMHLASNVEMTHYAIKNDLIS